MEGIESVEEVRAALRAWFDREARDLPWRRERSVYRTVVSEFMLQQTRVATVVPYFERWMERFPDWETLAAATEEEVLQLWQGLGYYARVRRLHSLARAVRDRGGEPASEAKWLELPGIGPYTAAAVASLAQGEPVAVVDGNVVRVLARLCGDRRHWKNSGAAVADYRAMADRFLDREHPGRHNEALMELGATVCLPGNPLCTVCPLVDHCRGAAEGDPGSIPRIGRAKTVERELYRAWAFRHGELLLAEGGSGEGRLEGLLELPTVDGLPRNWKVHPEPFAKRVRGIGRERITEWIVTVEPAKGRLCKGLRWVPLHELDEVALSGPHRRWIREILGMERG